MICEIEWLHSGWKCPRHRRARLQRTACLNSIAHRKRSGETGRLVFNQQKLLTLDFCAPVQCSFLVSLSIGSTALKLFLPSPPLSLPPSPVLRRLLETQRAGACWVLCDTPVTLWTVGLCYSTEAVLTAVIQSADTQHAGPQRGTRQTDRQTIKCVKLQPVILTFATRPAFQNQNKCS